MSKTLRKTLQSKWWWLRFAHYGDTWIK